MSSSTISRRRRALLSAAPGAAAAATLAGTALMPAAAAAQAAAPAYPTRPVTLVVPGPAGGTPDIVARQLAQLMRAELRQNLIVDNRAGANGLIGVSAVGRAAPDGYTVLMGFAQTMAINPVVSTKLPYDPLADFVPVARLVTFELGLVVPASVPAGNVRELVAWLKANPSKSAFGSFGAGTPSQFAGEMFRRKAGLPQVHVPYKGSAPLVVDLISGQVQYGFVVPQVALPHVKSGKLRLLAVTGERRSPALPGVPTMKELGFEDVVAAGWYGLFAPKNTPPAIVERLQKAAAAALRAPDFTRFLAQQDLSPAYLGGREFGSFQQAEIARWRAVAVRTDFKADE
ncbi:MAG: Bug family tripartite tricarboxylate transporter substrate binding protein [Burkholderiaceae bacterium]